MQKMITATEQRFTINRWVKSTFLGWLAGVVLIIALSSVLDSLGIEDMQFYLGVGMGAGVAFFQWRLLRKFISISANWIWISILGMGLPFVIIDFLINAPMPQKLLTGIAIGSLVTGVLQYFTLKKISAKAYNWIIGCVLGWTLSVVAVNSMDYTMNLKDYAPPLLLAILNLALIVGSGIVLGVATGIALKRILSSS